LDNRQLLSRTEAAPSVAYLAPPTDRDYPSAIQRILDRSASPTPSATRFEPHDGELPDHIDFDLIIVTGSAARIGDPEPWFDPLAEYLKRAIRSGTPTLGVCFGHQFLADLFGGRVTSLSEQRVTVSRIERTAAGRSDPLFSNLPDTFDSFVYHHDHVAELPPVATSLARNETGIQAFTLDDRPVHGVQFHPEFTDSMARSVGYDGDVAIEASRRIYSNLVRAIEPSDDVPSAGTV